MKRKLALFLVLAMILSLVPANVFASSNVVSPIPTVTEDYDFGVAANQATAPMLRVEETDEDDFAVSQSFTLNLTNAEWSTESASVYVAAVTKEHAGATVSVTYNSSTELEVAITDAVATGDDTSWIKFPMFAKVKDAGNATVKITSESNVSEGEYTFAKVGSGDTKVTYSADDVEKFSENITLGTLKIEELALGTLKVGDVLKFKLLNSDFAWDVTPVPTISMGGGYTGKATVTQGTDGDQIITVTVATLPSVTAKGSLLLKNLVVTADSDASFGDVKVKVYGDNVTTETITVATFSDYAVTVEADDETADLPTISAGFIPTTKAVVDGEIVNTSITNVNDISNDDSELSVLWIKEDVAGTLDNGKKIKVTLPDWVNIVSVEVDSDTDNVSDEATLDTTAADNGNEFEFTINKTSATAKYELGLKFFVTVKADAKGDIEASVSGKAMSGETAKAVIGTAVAPATMTAVVKDVRIGLKNQPVGVVTITEADAEQFAKGEFLVLSLDDMDLDGDAVVKVTKGDIEFKDPEFVDGKMLLEVDNESSEASTIEISGIELTIDRNLPEGVYDLNLGGSAVVMNNDGGDVDDDFFFDKANVASVPYAKNITPTSYDTKNLEPVVFTIGSTDYMIGAVKMTSDVAPYINAQGRTMLPLRALANAIGVADTSIMWNDAEHSVVIFKGDATLKVVIGQMTFNKNGVMVPMDTQAVIMNSRTFLPLRAMGEALGCVVTWDEATRTVTVTGAK